MKKKHGKYQILVELPWIPEENLPGEIKILTYDKWAAPREEHVRDLYEN